MKGLPQTFCLSVIGLLLLAYALGGKGVAHIGFGPIYISEVVLALSVTFFLMAPVFWNLILLPELWILLLLDFWCMLQTIPFIETYGIDAFRDAATYGYSAFAFIIAFQITNARVIWQAFHLYGKIVAPCVAAIGIALWLQPDDPDVKNSELPLILLKHGDVLVHMTGALSFALLGMRAMVVPANDLNGRMLRWLFWGALTITMLRSLSVSRGGLMACLCGVVVLALCEASRRYIIGLLAAGLTLLIILAPFALKQERDIDSRNISPWQIAENAVSIVSIGVGREEAVAKDLAGTAEWRLAWWNDIVDYTIFGNYFWTGKGFGINLADDDGYQADSEGLLRSPHNGHLTFLARAGVPGLTLWLLFLGFFAVAQVRMAKQMQVLGLGVLQRLNIWILSYWVAAAVNATFDVYLEGPQGGIWFWSITGFGLGLLAYQRRILAEGGEPVGMWVFRGETPPRWAA